MRYHGNVWGCLLLVLIAFSPPSAQAQQDLAVLTKGRVAAVVDPHSGRFTARTAEGKSLLFMGSLGLTSYVSVAIGERIYTNYPKSQMTAPWPLMNLGRGVVEALTDRLRYTWNVQTRDGIVRIIQELEPISDSLFEEVRIHLIVENETTEEVDVGMTVMEDLDADGNDHVLLRNAGARLDRERSYAGVKTPARLVMHADAFLPDSAGCRILGAHLTAPDIVTVGRWTYHGYLGTAVYGYRAADQPIWDTGVLLQWNARPLPAGQRREETTAVGFLPTQSGSNTAGTFARSFVVPLLTNAAVLSIVSDSATSVRISTPYVDSFTENEASRDGSWDTTVTITPDMPASVLLWLHSQSSLVTDSVSFYRQYFVTVESDRDIGIFCRDQLNAHTLDGSTVWPVARWDSLYLFHGLMGTVETRVFGSGVPTTVRITNTIEYFFGFHTFWFDHLQHPSSPAGGTITVPLPPGGQFAFSGQSYWPSFNHWDPTPPSERDLSPTGAGDILSSDTPMWCRSHRWRTLYPGKEFVSDFETGANTHIFDLPPRRQLGTEYVFIPFRKTRARVQDDLLRLIAYEDDTEVTLIDGTAPLQLDRGEYLDTLLAAPSVIRSDKPVAVFQHHLSWMYLDSDTTLAGAGLTLLPPEHWGTRFHVVTNDLFQPNFPPLLNGLGAKRPLEFENLYMIIVTKATQRSTVRINDTPVHPSAFTVFGEYAYAQIDIAPGYDIVSSDTPILVIVCGGMYVEYVDPGRNRLSIGMSYIPPFNDGDGTRFGGPGPDDKQQDRKPSRNDPTD